MGDGSLAVDTNLLDAGGTIVWTRTLNFPADVIATTIGGNRYLWFLYQETDRLPIDNSRINTGVLEADYESSPAPGSAIDLGSALLGNPAPGANLLVQSQGTLRLEVCGCSFSGPGAADFSIADCPTLIDPGSSQNLALGCTPSVDGVRSATLQLLTNDSASGGSFNYTVVCNASSAVPNPPAVVPARTPLSLALLALMLGSLGLLVLRRR